MPMPVWIGAFTVNLAVFLICPVTSVQSVGSIKPFSSCKIDHMNLVSTCKLSHFQSFFQNGSYDKNNKNDELFEQVWILFPCHSIQFN